MWCLLAEHLYLDRRPLLSLGGVDAALTYHTHTLSSRVAHAANMQTCCENAIGGDSGKGALRLASVTLFLGWLMRGPGRHWACSGSYHSTEAATECPSHPPRTHRTWYGFLCYTCSCNGFTWGECSVAIVRVYMYTLRTWYYMGQLALSIAVMYDWGKTYMYLSAMDPCYSINYSVSLRLHPLIRIPHSITQSVTQYGFGTTQKFF